MRSPRPDGTRRLRALNPAMNRRATFASSLRDDSCGGQPASLPARFARPGHRTDAASGGDLLFAGNEKEGEDEGDEESGDAGGDGELDGVGGGDGGDALAVGRRAGGLLRGEILVIDDVDDGADSEAEERGEDKGNNR